MYVFGGWNSKEQFTDMHIFDSEANTWSTLDQITIGEEPRWNHSACSIVAVPHWQIFMFGGMSGNLAAENSAQVIQNLPLYHVFFFVLL